MDFPVAGSTAGGTTGLKEGIGCGPDFERSRSGVFFWKEIRGLGRSGSASAGWGFDGAVDPRCDIYSLGIVLFEMTTTQAPFDGSTTVEVALKHVQELVTQGGKDN